jgi:hypothetical protein
MRDSFCVFFAACLRFPAHFRAMSSMAMHCRHTSVNAPP